MTPTETPTAAASAEATPEPMMSIELTCQPEHEVYVRGAKLEHGKVHTLPARDAAKLVKRQVAKPVPTPKA